MKFRTIKIKSSENLDLSFLKSFLNGTVVPYTKEGKEKIRRTIESNGLHYFNESRYAIEWHEQYGCW